MIYGFVTIGVVAGFVYLLFFSGQFEVTEIKISKPDVLKDLNVSRSVNNWLDQDWLSIKRRNNTAFINLDNLDSVLRSQFAQIKGIKASKNLPHAINIEVKAREPEGIWCSGGECFYFDDEGIAYKRSAESSGFLLTSVKDRRGRRLGLGERVEESIWLDSIILARDLLSNSGFAVREFIIPDGSFDEFHARTSFGFDIYISFSTSIRRQLDAFVIAWKDKIPNSKKSQLEYVNLTVPGRIYYK